MNTLRVNFILFLKKYIIKSKSIYFLNTFLLQICSSYAYRSISVEEYISDTCRAAAQRNSNLEQRGTQYPSFDCKSINTFQNKITIFKTINY